MTGVPILGIDLGGVVLCHGEDCDPAQTLSGLRPLETPVIDEVFEVLPRLVERFNGNCFVVSAGSPALQHSAQEWVCHNHFCERTGVPVHHIHYCTHRAEKAPIAQQLGLTHFVDDKPDVLRYMIGVVPHLYLFAPRERDCHGFEPILHHFTLVHTWDELYHTICATVR